MHRIRLGLPKHFLERGESSRFRTPRDALRLRVVNIRYAHQPDTRNRWEDLGVYRSDRSGAEKTDADGGLRNLVLCAVHWHHTRQSNSRAWQSAPPKFTEWILFPKV